MKQKKRTAIKPTRSENFPKWYQNVIKESNLAEKSPVRGSMVIKPWGYAIWENITNILNSMFKDTGVKNTYFPLLIPLSFMEKEAKHVKGFAKECAVVTHHKLIQQENGELKPGGKLSEPLIIRPTSETIIGNTFSKWIKSYRDLPILINQWANIIRWEMRTRMFLRTTEFLWQEGHTAHSNMIEAKNRAKLMLKIYEKLAREYLAMPIISGKKSESEKFPGAIETLCIEAMMQDRKALQVGTSHFLGQNFAKASNIKFQTKNKNEELAWTTSWGVSTRLIGGIVMTHGDDNGIIIPPRITPSHIVILPIFKNTVEQKNVMKYINKINEKIKKISYYDKKIVIEIDSRDIGGARKWDWIKKGIPIIIEIGPRDIKSDSLYFTRRDQLESGSKEIKQDYFISKINSILEDIHNNLFKKAEILRINNTHKINSKKDFYDFFQSNSTSKNESFGGFAISPWCGEKKCENTIKKELSVTIRCLSINQEKNSESCINCNKKSINNAVFGRSY